MDWENNFAQHILERGYDYYLSGSVKNLVVSGDSVQADVKGTENYEVEIYLDGNNITYLYCSCPYAGSGSNCKHMAAVLYQWTEKLNGRNISANKDDVEKIVEHADISVVRSFLTSVLKGDEKLLMRFNSMVGTYPEKKDVKQYIRQVSKIIYRYSGRGQFIDYRQAGDFVSELNEIYQVDVRRMIDRGQYMAAFEVINHIFTSVETIAIDDSDGGIGMLAYEACQLWQELSRLASPEEKDTMFSRLLEQIDKPSGDYMEEYVETALMEGFSEEKYLRQKLAFTEKMVKNAQQEESGWERHYQIGRWAIRHLELLDQLNCGSAEKMDYCKKHWENPQVRKYFIDLCMKSKEYGLALNALDESISLDYNFTGLLCDYQKLKKEIYLITGDKKSYVEQLWFLLLNYNTDNLETYRELKQQYTEDEWLDKREIIFEKLPPNAQIDYFYLEEKLYDRLLDNVLKSPGLYKVQKYTEFLKADYPEQILQKYAVELNQEASTAKNRKRYQEITTVLRSVMEISGGEEVVEKLVGEWKKIYKNRPAMMNELGKLLKK